LTMGVNGMHLKNTLGQIDPDSCNLAHGAFPSNKGFRLTSKTNLGTSMPSPGCGKSLRIPLGCKIHVSFSAKDQDQWHCLTTCSSTSGAEPPKATDCSLVRHSYLQVSSTSFAPLSLEACAYSLATKVLGRAQ